MVTPQQRQWTVPLLAALLASLHPYFIVMSVLLLSEAVFVPLMLAALWGTAVLWRCNGLLVAFGVGAASGAAILVRPSWALFVPLILGIWLIATCSSRGKRLAALGQVLVVAIGLCLVMSPWWVRNARIYARFIPTAVWLGASLYDGLNPRATGASDMSFLNEPDFWPLDELDQDAELTRGALEFVREQPGRVIKLAIIKLGRYWSPWPNAEGYRQPLVAVASTALVVPLLGLLALGLWRTRGEPRVWVLLAGPLLYFCALHTVFASSMRYRIPGEAPAMGLAALGWIHESQARRRL
jgi:hypothetical protein